MQLEEPERTLTTLLQAQDFEFRNAWDCSGKM